MTGIPQGSPISPILFLIYIRDIQPTIPRVKIYSYIDDIAVFTSSRSIKKNITYLQRATDQLLAQGERKAVKFDLEKIDLIHFFINKRPIPKKGLFINNKEIRAKSLVRWLGVLFDTRLTFKNHIQQKLASAERAYYQLNRLSSTQLGLSLTAIRQLYLACVTTIADYGSPLWFTTRKLPIGFDSLQNKALRQGLGVFKTSPIQALELELGLAPTKVRLSRQLLRYSNRVNLLPSQNPVKSIIQRLKYQENQQDNLVLDFSKSSSTYYPRPKGVSQLKRIASLIATNITTPMSINTRRKKQKDYILHPWKNNISKINLFPKEGNKEKETYKKEHLELVSSLENDWGENNLLLYTDGSKIQQKSSIGIYQYPTTTISSLALPTLLEIVDIELYAIYLSIIEARELIERDRQKKTSIWIFSDSNSAIQKIQRLQKYLTTDYLLYRLNHLLGPLFITNINPTTGSNININIAWIPSHIGIEGNEKADFLAKEGLEEDIQPREQLLPPSHGLLNREINKKTNILWNQLVQKEKLGKEYSKTFIPTPGFKGYKEFKASSRATTSAFFQLKLGHGYNASYFHRFKILEASHCFYGCSSYQTPSHLLLDCSNNLEARKKLLQELEHQRPTLNQLFSTAKGRRLILDLIKATRISTRSWFLENTNSL